MVKKILRFKTIALCVLLSCIYSFAHASPIKIACVNMQRVVKESTTGKEKSQQGNEIIQQKRARIVGLEEEIRKMINDYKEKEMVLSPDAKKEIKDSIERKMIDKERFEKDAYRELRKFEKKVIAEIVVEVNKIIDRIAEQEGFTLILNSTGEDKEDDELQLSSILYAKPELDITDRVIKLYDKKHK
jgi:outer membrane protein